MMSLVYPEPENYVTDSTGTKTHVILRLKDYEELIEELEDFRDIEERMKNPEFVDFKEVKNNLGL